MCGCFWIKTEYGDTPAWLSFIDNQVWLYQTTSGKWRQLSKELVVRKCQ